MRVEAQDGDIIEGVKATIRHGVFASEYYRDFRVVHDLVHHASKTIKGTPYIAEDIEIAEVMDRQALSIDSTS